MSTKVEPPDLPDTPMSEHGTDLELGVADAAGSDQLERLRSKLSLQDQTSRLPFKKLLVVFFGLAISLLLSFLDMTSVSTALPSVAREFQSASEVSWVGTSFLIANTSMQILYGRLSDVFGRKVVLMSAIGLFAVGNLLCGFSQSMLQLIIFRGFSGAGGGGIVSLSMIIVSDIVSLKDRGKYQGFLGSAIAIGGGIGPLIGGVFSQTATWRWVFWFSVPISVLILIQLYFFLPLTKVSGNMGSKLRKIDYAGSVISLAATIFVMVPVSGGGVTYPWNSPLVIVLLTLGVLLYIIFVIYEAKYAKIPIMPMHLFKIRSVSLILWQTFLVGIVYYGVLYYLPIYSQVLQHRSVITSGVLLLPLIITQTFTATLAGLILAKTGHYNPCIIGGFALWTLGLGLQTTFSPDISLGKIIGFLILEGFGIGLTFQTTLVAAQATSPQKDRAVVTGARNFFRTIGGAFGLGFCSAILNNTLASRLAAETSISPELRAQIIKSAFALPPLTPDQLAVVMDAYAAGIRGIFLMFVPLGGICFLMALFVEDVGLPDDMPKDEGNTSPVSVGDATSEEEDPSGFRSDSDIPHEIPIGERQNLESKEKISEGEEEEKT